MGLNQSPLPLRVRDVKGGFGVSFKGASAFALERADSFELVLLTVPRAHRRKGIGTALYLEAKAEAERRGKPLVHGTSTNPYVLRIRKRVFG